MSTRKNTKFNKNNGYKDFTFSKHMMNNDIYNVSDESRNESYSDSPLYSKLESKPSDFKKK